MKVEIDVKYGRNVIELPLNVKPSFVKSGLGNFFRNKITLYSDITANGQRMFERTVIDQCCIYGQQAEKNDNTVRRVVNSKNVITKAVDRYKPPIEYMALPSEERKSFYTVQAGDFIVFEEVSDEVNNANDFMIIQQKYKENGIKVMSVNVNINGMAVDNIEMANV